MTTTGRPAYLQLDSSALKNKKQTDENKKL